MTGLSLSLFVVMTSLSTTGSTTPEQGVSLVQTQDGRSASLLGGLELAASWKPSSSEPLRITDDLRFLRGETPLPLDEGGGVSGETRQILALILGFVPGFGLGHLIARDKDGFILFLIIDVAIYALWGTLGFVLKGPFWGLGGLVWIVVHIIQGLDAYAQAGGPRIVQRLRDKAVEVASSGGLRESPVVTTRVLGFEF